MLNKIIIYSNNKIKYDPFDSDSNTLALFDFRKNQSYSTDLCGNTWTLSNSSSSITHSISFTENGLVTSGKVLACSKTPTQLNGNKTLKPFTMEGFVALNVREQRSQDVFLVKNNNTTARLIGIALTSESNANLSYLHVWAASSTYLSSPKLEVGQFYHVALTCDSNSQCKYYVNGILCVYTTVTVSPTNVYILGNPDYTNSQDRTAKATIASYRLSNIVRYTENFSDRVDLKNLRIIE